MPLTPENIVPYDIALEWVERWRSTPCEDRSPVDLKGFLIPMADMQQVMLETGIVNVRGYFGIDGIGISKMLIVGVDVQGNDMIDASKGWYIYDLTQPCPPVCGTGGLANLKP